MRLLYSALTRYRRRSRSRGQSIVELALILPVLMLLVASALDLGRMFYSQVTITNAAREGAYEAAYQPTSFQANAPCNSTNNRVMCRVLSEAKGSFVTVAKADVGLACAPSCAKAIGNTVTVTVTGNFTLLTPILAPFMGGNNVTLTSTATSQIITDPPDRGRRSHADPTPTPTPTPAPTRHPDADRHGNRPAPTATPVPTVAPCFAPNRSFTVTPIERLQERDRVPVHGSLDEHRRRLVRRRLVLELRRRQRQRQRRRDVDRPEPDRTSTRSTTTLPASP